MDLTSYSSYSGLRAFIRAAQILRRRPDGSFSCWLNTRDHEQDFYDFPYGFLEINKRKRTVPTGLESFSVEAVVKSIDDVSVPMIGPIESSAKADARLEQVVAGIREWSGYLPPLKDIERFCRRHGLYLNL